MMIDEIHVQNVALIREATLVPSRGLTVLTGETGAGKTALLSACKLLCGDRADASAVREGEKELAVEGRFFNRDEEQVISRRVSIDGRSRVAIDGVMASIKELQAAVGPMVDLCGQHEHQQLLKTSSHVGLLDAWASESISSAHEAYRLAFAQVEAATAELKRVADARFASNARLDEARFTLARIDALKPKEGEYEELVASLSKAEHSESLALACESAFEALSGEAGAIDTVQKAVSLLNSVAAIDARLGELAGSLREANFALEDISQETRNYRDSIEFDPQILDANRARVAAL
ncbi:MAG: AAA family ATPase, partial [Eggerthellaceae bacterium]|nr:AAA family ATPase [Eggerthellaceae bacterium]